MQNVKRAISRYGTLPKGARIGAYLESLRQSGLANQPESNPKVIEQTESNVRSLSPRTNIRTQPQMIRSNSSSGVTTFHNPHHPPSSPTATKLNRNRTAISRNNSEAVTLRTFRAGHNSFRGGSPSRATQPSLADLEFPPPPSDLPPPPEEFDGEFTDESFKRDQTSPLPVQKSIDDIDGPVKNSDTHQPLVEEASSRFGINLRHREPSTDSCSSAKSNREESKDLTVPSNLSLTSPSIETKSPMSVDSDVPIVGSPLEPLPPPPSFPELTDEENQNDKSEEEDKSQSKLFKTVNLTMKEMLELKLVAEIKERADQKFKNSKEPSPNEQFNISSVNSDPLAQLVSELSETMNMEVINNSDLKPGIRKTSQNQVTGKSESETLSYKTQLKKVDPPIKRPNNKEEVNNTTSGIIDFKSRLRKVDNAPEKKTEREQEEEVIDKTIIYSEMEQSQDSNKRESTASSDSSANLKIDESDDKRKSTGSISSLKKLWESKEASENIGNIQLSPKLSLKNTKNELQKKENQDNDNANEGTPTVEIADESPLIRCASGRSTGKVWPPNSDEKPVVPVKPVVKAVKPILSSAKPGPAIYATPVAPKPPILAKPTNLDNKLPEDNSENVKLTNSDKTERDSILEISQALETSLNSIRSNPTVSTATWLQLSDKIGLLHGSCMGYADSVVPAHTKFHFRELLTRLETQGRQLRSAGSRNITENTRQLNEVTNTVKDVVNAVKIF